jgi:hypothetical protein
MMVWLAAVGGCNSRILTLVRALLANVAKAKGLCVVLYVELVGKILFESAAPVKTREKATRKTVDE